MPSKPAFFLNSFKSEAGKAEKYPINFSTRSCLRRQAKLWWNCQNLCLYQIKRNVFTQSSVIFWWWIKNRWQKWKTCEQNVLSCNLFTLSTQRVWDRNSLLQNFQLIFIWQKYSRWVFIAWGMVKKLINCSNWDSSREITKVKSYFFLSIFNCRCSRPCFKYLEIQQ